MSRIGGVEMRAMSAARRARSRGADPPRPPLLIKTVELAGVAFVSLMKHDRANSLPRRSTAWPMKKLSSLAWLRQLSQQSCRRRRLLPPARLEQLLLGVHARYCLRHRRRRSQHPVRWSRLDRLHQAGHVLRAGVPALALPLPESGRARRARSTSALGVPGERTLMAGSSRRFLGPRGPPTCAAARRVSGHRRTRNQKTRVTLKDGHHGPHV
jgi:hypothetical protein